MQLTVLGSTGSIGQSTLDVVARHPDRYSVFALTGYSRIDILAEQCARFSPRFAVVPSAELASNLKARLALSSTDVEVLSGADSLCQVAADPAVDAVMAAIVGAAGLPATMAAVNAGKKVLLANKESLVMAGELFMSAVARSGAELLPIDSEHNAIFQCLPADYQSVKTSGVKKILLSGSGGPFRNTHLEQLASVTPEQACNHPNWSMGKKISVDSATMMNKGLELIEACWLFGVGPELVDIVIHPQSIVHSLVQYADGSVLAQLGNPDMRTPIAHALAWPERIDAGVSMLDLIASPDLVFQTPDFERFPCLLLAIEAAKVGQSAPIVLNAANEVAVEAFLQNQIGFTDIAEIVGTVLHQSDLIKPESLDDVLSIDRQARLAAQQSIENLGK